MRQKGLGSWLCTCKWPHGANLLLLAQKLQAVPGSLPASPPPALRVREDPHGDLRGWLTHDRGILGRELGPLGVAWPRQGHGGAGRKALWRRERKRRAGGGSQLA